MRAGTTGAVLTGWIVLGCGGSSGSDGGVDGGGSAGDSSGHASSGSGADSTGGDADVPYAACGGRIVDPQTGAIDPVEYELQARSWDRATIDCRLGPHYADVHDADAPDTRPDLWEPPVDPAKSCNNDGTMNTYEYGPPECSNECSQPSDTYGSVSAQAIYATDDPTDPGVDRVLTHAWEMRRVATRPQPAPGGSHPDPGLGAGRWPSIGFADPKPHAMARAPFAGNWANCALTIFDDGFVGPLCTRTTGVPSGREVGFAFPDNLVPTAVALTTMNELALVSLWDVDTQTGKLAVFAMHGNYPSNASSTWWYVALPNSGGFSAMKLLGYLDLPIATPTAISAVSNGYRDSPHDHWVMNLGDIVLAVDGDCSAEMAQNFVAGGSLSHLVSSSGYAIVASRWENKAVFVDLTPLLAWVRAMYFEDDARCDAEVGPMHDWDDLQPTHFDGADVFPQTFDVVPEAMPQVAAVVDVPAPRDVFAGLQYWKASAGDPEPPKAWILSDEGALHVYDAGGLVTRHPDDTPDGHAPSELAAFEVCPHPTALSPMRGDVQVPGSAVGSESETVNVNARNSGIHLVCRGDRRIESWTHVAGASALQGALEDAAMNDPVALETSMRGPIWTVADFAGEQLVNYQTADIVGTGCTDTNVPVTPTGDIAINRGGTMTLAGAPYLVTETNVN